MQHWQKKQNFHRPELFASNRRGTIGRLGSTCLIDTGATQKIWDNHNPAITALESLCILPEDLA